MAPTDEQWRHLVPEGLTEHIAGMTGNELEQYGAQLRDQLDLHGVSTADPDQLYAALAGTWVFLELLTVAKISGLICPASFQAIMYAYRGEVAGLLPAIPEAAHR